MTNAFAEIIRDRGWTGTRMAKILNNIQNRLKKRLPEGVEPSLTKFQKKAIYSPNFWRDWNSTAEPNHLMVQGATSAGKTLLSELNILDTLRHDQKAIVLVPLKAMVHERTTQFKEDMGHGLPEYDIKVFGSSGDYMEYDEQLINGEHDVAIIVYEKFFAMLSQGNTEIMKDCGLLIVDELSMLSSEQRGSKLEMAMEIVHRKYPDTRIMCLATCDCSTEKVCEWLNIENSIISTARPVALEEHILELNGKGAYRIIHEDYEREPGDEGPERLEEEIDIPNYKSDWRTHEKERQLLLSVISLIYKNTPDSRVLVFVPTQSKAAAIAEFLKDSLMKWVPQEEYNNKTVDEEFISALEACDRDEGQEKLIDELIPYGIAYHHAGISTTLRELIEVQFSKPHSNLRVIVATETLTIGVNMPFDAMIMLSNMVPRGIGTMVPLSMQEYRNYIGRAGRLGQNNRTGVTYLFVETPRDLEKYWGSYYNHDEVISSLTRVGTRGIAPYHLSLLNNSIKTAADKEVTENDGTTYTLSKLKTLYEQSLSKICGQREFSEIELNKHLYNAYLSDDRKGGAHGRGDTREEFAITDFGTYMAPYAFSMDTCIKIYYYFYEGYRHYGLPLGISQQDIESDRYLLDILYHVCRHKEIEKSSNLLFPTGDNSLSRSYNAKGRVLEQLRSILSETDENGNLQNVLWCDAYDNAKEEDKENNDIWLLLNKSNLIDESLKLQAAMRAIILFYWTKGYNIKKICETTKFNTFTKIISGDIERIADVTSFHLDAIYKCLKHAYDPQSGKEVYQDTAALKAFYALHTRVKYGMPRDLVVFANKHIHGLDRQRLLSLKNEADKSELTPIQYLYITPPGKISEKILTATQQVQLRQAIERRGSRSINTLMEIIENDLATDLTSEQLDCLRTIAGWGDADEKEIFDSQDIYRSIKDISKNPALKSVKVSSDGVTCKIIWSIGEDELHIGVLSSAGVSSEICEFFNESSLSKILIVPHSFSDEQMKNAQREHHADSVLDNVYFTFVLAKAIRIPVDKGSALTEMLADLRGIFTKTDYDHFPLLRYLSNSDMTTPSYRLIYGNSIAKRFENNLSESTLESALRATDGLQNFEILPWGRKLNSNAYDFTECPTVILLNRSDITHSASLTQFIYKMQNQKFGNCILLLESEFAKHEWDSNEVLEEPGNSRWSNQFNKIRKTVVCDVQMALQEIRTFVTNWKHKGYLIGISYAHYDPNPSENISGYNDVDLITRLANKLSCEYGEDRILFDQFDPAKKLFDDNRGEDKSLNAYKSCRFYLILWNAWTYENQNCRKERDIIIERCKDDTNKCIFLQVGHPNDPGVPEGYFSQPLSADTLEPLYERIKEMIDNLLK